jgi:hypothetical protein
MSDADKIALDLDEHSGVRYSRLYKSELTFVVQEH